MPTTLTPQEQLTAANAQLKTWYNQQLAQTGAVLGGEYEAKAYAIATSGNYPALEVAVRNGTTGGFDTIFALPQDIGPYDTIISNNTGAGTGQLINTPQTNLTAQQYAAALATSNPSSAFDSALNSAYAAQTAREDAASAATSETTQPIITANQGNPVIVPTPPTNSNAVNAAADNRDRQAGSITAPSDSNSIAAASAESAATNQAAINSDNAAAQTTVTSQAARNEASSDTNSAQTNGASVTTTVTPTVDPRGTNQIPTDATSISPNQTVNSATNGKSEDNPSGNPPQNIDTVSKPSSSIASDQTATSNSDVAPKSGADSYNSGPNGGTARVTSSGPATNDSTSGASGSGSGSGNGGNSPTYSNTSNKLHAYTNSTYKISLYAVPVSTINKMVGLDPSSDPGPTLLSGAVFILSDGGRGASGGDKSYFPLDLSIDNLEIESIVTPTQRTRGTDVITMKFDIIEPYTTNFLENCYKINQKFNPGANASWDTLFFMMVIEFLGYDDMGQPQKIKNTTKYIPFTFLNMRFKINSSGTIYSCTVIPTNLLANSGIDNTIPFHVETQATTIAELFEATEFSGTTSSQVANRDRSGSETSTTSLNAQSNLAKSGADIIVTKGLQSALNQNEIDKTKGGAKDQDGAAAPINKGQYLPNKYNFKFHTDILNAQIADPKAFSERSVGSTSGDSKDPKTAQLKQGGKVGNLIADFSKKTFRAQAGTKITDFINSVIKVSSYVLNQVSTQANVDTPVNWWKINPTIQFGSLDKGTNFYQREITYNIVPYVIRGQDSPNFGQQQVQKSEIVKLYEYIYSGNNRDVLDVNIDYQMAFFEVKNGVSTRYTIQSKDNIKDSGDSQVAVYNGYTDNRFFKPRYFHTTGIANQQNTSDTTGSDKQIVAQDFMEKLFDNAGDMISLDLTIVGDPDWISQDVPLFGPILPNGSFLGSGSVNFTNPVYFNFYFATPDSDYDNTSGLFNSGGKYSQFSGIYHVIAVKSNFNGGKFTQKLKNVRVRNQTAPKAPAARTDSIPSQTVNAATRGANENAPVEPATNGTAAPDSTTIPNPPANPDVVQMNTLKNVGSVQDTTTKKIYNPVTGTYSYVPQDSSGASATQFRTNPNASPTEDAGTQ